MSTPHPEFETFTRDRFGLQSWVLRRLPPLSNDRVFRLAIALLMAEVLCALGAIPGVPAAVSPVLALVGLALLGCAHAVVLLLTFAGDALPEEYGRLVNVRERLHPITMAALVYLVLAHVTAFATGYAALQRLDPNTWADGLRHPYLALWVFSYLTTFTIAFGDLQPASTAVRLLLVLQVAASATMLFGMVAVIVSSYVGVLDRRRELLAALRSPEAAGGTKAPTGGDQSAGRKEDVPGQGPTQLGQASTPQEPAPQIQAGDAQGGLAEDRAGRASVQSAEEERPMLSDQVADDVARAGDGDSSE
ncbi:MAG: hypothetical protein IT347_01765 [Candidatus Eisenbacteria bacterium]|nr:hypothetical protein [Candidatus Eisenbacteria bacterium]